MDRSGSVRTNAHRLSPSSPTAVLGASLPEFTHCAGQPCRVGKPGPFPGPSRSRLQAPGLASAPGVPSHRPQKALSSFPTSGGFIPSLVLDLPGGGGGRGNGTRRPGETFFSPPPPHPGPASGPPSGPHAYKGSALGFLLLKYE